MRIYEITQKNEIWSIQHGLSYEKLFKDYKHVRNTFILITTQRRRNKYIVVKDMLIELDNDISRFLNIHFPDKDDSDLDDKMNYLRHLQKKISGMIEELN